MKIAIIGSGISGLSAAFYLSKKHNVDLFEREDHFGGHAHTIDLKIDDIEKKSISIDVGFIVFNYLTYPTYYSWRITHTFSISCTDRHALWFPFFFHWGKK